MSNKDIARAVALGEGDTASDMYNALSDNEKAQYQGYLTVVFGVMLGVRFENDSSRDAIDHFMNEVKSGYHALGERLQPLKIEATVRGVLGEEELLNEVAPHEQVSAQMLVIRLLTATMPQINENLDAYLTDAETLMSRLNEA